MVGDHMINDAVRAWKHRYAQTLYEAFCMSGLERSAALYDAYAHADTQYPLRGEGSPEDEARLELVRIQAHISGTAANSDDGAVATPNPHNGAHHVGSSVTQLFGRDDDTPSN